MAASGEHEVVKETWAMFQVAVEGGEGLEITVLPGLIPVRGASKAMFLVANRYARSVVDLKGEGRLLEAAPQVRLGAVTFRQTSLLPGEVSFGTIEVATDGAMPGDHGVGLTVSYRLAPAEAMRGRTAPASSRLLPTQASATLPSH